MSGPDYPVLGLPSYETYQLAHIATYLAEQLGRHRRAARGRAGVTARAAAVCGLAGAAAALDGFVDIPSAEALPAPLDAATYRSARDLVSHGARTADVVSLAPAGQSGWAVLGNIPGIGAVGARTGSREVADALRVFFMTEPSSEVSAWSVTARSHRVPTLPARVDLATFVEHLDPSRATDRAVAAELLGTDRRTDAAIAGRFANVDLDGRLPVRRGSTGQQDRRPAHSPGGRRDQRPHDERRPERNQGGPTPGA